MKRPKRLLEDGELSNIIVTVCLFLASISAVFVLLQDNVLSFQERICYIVVSIIVAIFLGVILFFTYKKIKMRKESEDATKAKKNANEGGHKDDIWRSSGYVPGFCLAENDGVLC